MEAFCRLQEKGAAGLTFPAPSRTMALTHGHSSSRLYKSRTTFKYRF
jgi:hypothetical protein